MLRLEELKVGQQIEGLLPEGRATIIQVMPAGADARLVFYQSQNGALASQTVYRESENRLSLAESGLAWSFDAPGDEFRLALEAERISLGHLFDPMMAVHASNVEPLPHQISAVYDVMLQKHPLRFVLADDPGAGKTVMAGLLIKELMIRGDARRILVVAPGSLTEQWQDELREKFSLEFKLVSNEAQRNCPSGNLFADENMLIGRVDMLSRSEDYVNLLRAAPEWDLVIVDEAHKLSAHMTASGIDTTKRYDLGMVLGGRTRHLLLMTATPHNGKEADFQAWMALLDSDRFQCREQTDEKVDVSDLMRRLVKEELLRFDGTKLFPERRAYTVNFTLTPAEHELYEAVTEYVRNEMNRADRIQNVQKRNCVGFALTMLQRRLASSPAAIHLSIKRRIERLEKRLGELQEMVDKSSQADAVLLQWEKRFSDSCFDADEDLSSDEMDGGALDDGIDAATAAQTIPELGAEIETLKALERQAQEILDSAEDTKWAKLREVFDTDQLMKREDGTHRKLIVFTEHKDTLNYLANRISEHIGDQKAVVTISGSTSREERRAAQNEFRNNRDVVVMVATDAAGEGVNLQNANLMVNYDIPWNPNRLEQRFGRIHRIGQTEMCHLWNMVAYETREGDVFRTLFEKLETERAALGGRVFDILGEAFADCNLKDLLVDAIRKGDTPEARAWMTEKVDSVLDTEHLREVMRRNSLVAEAMDEESLFRVREEMDRAEARKLQPCYLRDFTAAALSSANAELRTREKGRYEIPNVPHEVRENLSVTGLSRDRIPRKYERVCFDKSSIHVRQGDAAAELIHSGHPLMRSLTSGILAKSRCLLKAGTVMVDPADEGTEPSLLFMIDHSVRDSSVSEGRDGGNLLSRRLQFVRLRPDGMFSSAGWAPHLDLEKAGALAASIAEEVKLQPWLSGDLESKAIAFATEHMAREHFDEVSERRRADVEKTKEAVHSRLVTEINRYDSRSIALKTKYGETNAVIDKTNADKMYETARMLERRLKARMDQLAAEEAVVSGAPTVIGGILVIPQGLVNQRTGDGLFSADADARRRVEKLAMDAVTAVELRLGNIPRDVSADKCGWDITSTPPRSKDGSQPPDRHIEVKGRIKGADTVTVTKNEVLTALNQSEKFILAVCFVDGEAVDGPYYVRRPFDREMDFKVVSQNYDLKELLRNSERMS